MNFSEEQSYKVTPQHRDLGEAQLCFGGSDQAGEDIVLHEHVEFSFESLGGGFSLDQVRTKSIELGALLSLLTALPPWLGVDKISACVIGMDPIPLETGDRLTGSYDQLSRGAQAVKSPPIRSLKHQLRLFLRKIKRLGESRRSEAN